MQPSGFLGVVSPAGRCIFAVAVQWTPRSYSTRPWPSSRIRRFVSQIRAAKVRATINWFNCLFSAKPLLSEC